MTDDTTETGEQADGNRPDRKGGTAAASSGGATAQVERAPDGDSVADAPASGDGALESTVEGVDENLSDLAADEGEVVHTTSPLLKPVLALIGAVVLVGAIVVGALLAAPDLVGGVTVAEILLNATLLLVALIVLRLAVRVLVLRRTEYTIRTDGFEKSYELAYRRNERRIPVEQLRGQEFNRGRFQSLFGCATISLLTGGTNRSLGFVEFEHLPDAERVQELIRGVRKRHERQREA